MSISNRKNAFLNARKPSEVVSADHLDIEDIFGKDKVIDFNDDVMVLYIAGINNKI